MCRAGDSRLPQLHRQPYLCCFARFRVAEVLSLLSLKLVRQRDHLIPYEQWCTQWCAVSLSV